MRPFRIALVTAVAALALLAATAAWSPRPSRRASSRPGRLMPRVRAALAAAAASLAAVSAAATAAAQDLIEYALMAGFVPSTRRSRRRKLPPGRFRTIVPARQREGTWSSSSDTWR